MSTGCRFRGRSNLWLCHWRRQSQTSRGRRVAGWGVCVGFTSEASVGNRSWRSLRWFCCGRHLGWKGWASARFGGGSAATGQGASMREPWHWRTLPQECHPGWNSLFSDRPAFPGSGDSFRSVYEKTRSTVVFNICSEFTVSVWSTYSYVLPR
jgi:hypothetical protein